MLEENNNDTAQDDDDDNDNPAYYSYDDSSAASIAVTMPTLPRYPVAESRDLNCWSEPPLDIFRVRGPHYLKDKKKVPSDPFLMRARGCDLLLFPPDAKHPPVTMMERCVY